MAGSSNRRSLLTLADMTSDEIVMIGETAFRYGQEPRAFAGQLKGTRIGLMFIAPSTRTRTSFWSAATNLGCDVLHLGPIDLQLSTGETWSDTGNILANYLDVIVVRTNGPQRELAELANHIPATINALTYEEHPTQAIADLCAMREHFGKIEGIRVAYLGEVNNTSRSLAMLVCKLPFGGLDVYSPEGSGFSTEEVKSLNALGGRKAVRQFYQIPSLPDPVDVVYTTRWQSMGKPHAEPDWLFRFKQFAVTRGVMSLFSGSSEAVFMHDLPAVRDQEVTSDVLDGINTNSLVLRQVHHKASAAASAQLWAMGKI
jgi:ornithine carbamoyltransferase